MWHAPESEESPAVAVTQSRQAADGSTGLGQATIELDAAGFPLPLTRQWRQAVQDRLTADFRDELAIDPPQPRSSSQIAIGLPELAEAVRLARLCFQRGLYPPVPASLLRAPTESIMALPDGTFCLHGAPGSFNPLAPSGYGELTGKDEWLHYGPHGNLLGRVDRHDDYLGDSDDSPDWLPLTWQGYAAFKRRELAAGHALSVRNGYTVVWSNERVRTFKLGEVEPAARLEPGEAELEANANLPRQLLAIYDWDGRPLPLDQPLTRPQGYCLEMSWDLVSARQK
jgi:hypothetical protein